MTDWRFIALVAGASAATFGGIFFLTGAPAAQASARQAVDAAIFYPGCDTVRALGKAPLLKGQPGYRAEMDGDGDGIACEPHAGGGDGFGGHGHLGRQRRRR